MARGTSTLLTSSTPYGSAPTEITIGHVQLRDVLICPHERGVVCYPQSRTILEHDLTTSAIDRVTNLAFLPNSLSSFVLPNTDETLLAAGGQEGELHLSLYARPSFSDPEYPSSHLTRNFGRQRWRSEVVLDPPASINNSVHLTSLNLTGSHGSSAEPRVVISNNDKTVKFYDIAVRARGSGTESTIMNRLSNPGGTVQRLCSIGQLHLDVPVNHSSISPDGRTLLSVGDSPDIYLHRISGSSRVSFTPMTRLSLGNFINTPSYLYNPHNYPNSAVAASFSTAFSANGSKFAVASQEGVVVVWDVRSTKPLKVIQTDKSRRSGDRGSGSGNGAASGWIADSPWDWSRGLRDAPGWGVRSVKFSPAGVGREVMTFTEHTSLLHVVDARTFETEEIVRVPNFDPAPSTSSNRTRSRSSSPPIRAPVESPSVENHSLPTPPRILLFSGAVEDTFRIPISESGSRRRRHARRSRGARDEGTSTMTDEDPDLNDIVVIPPMGDLEVENDVRRLLGRRTSHARARTSIQRATFSSRDDSREIGHERGRDDEMDVDDFEADCLSSHTPSRASSPALLTPTPSSSSNPYPQYPVTATSTTANSHPTASLSSANVRLPMPSHIADHFRVSPPSLRSSLYDSSRPYRHQSPAEWTSSLGSRRYQRRSAQREYDDEGNHSTSVAAGADTDYDLAGMCFDPAGEFVYVGATKGVCAWKVRGAEKSWWIDSAWA